MSKTCRPDTKDRPQALGRPANRLTRPLVGRGTSERPARNPYGSFWRRLEGDLWSRCPVHIGSSALWPRWCAALCDAITDVTRMGEWSPECYRCVWLDGATAAYVGARFRGYNKLGRFRWATTAVITAVTKAGCSLSPWCTAGPAGRRLPGDTRSHHRRRESCSPSRSSSSGAPSRTASLSFPSPGRQPGESGHRADPPQSQGGRRGLTSPLIWVRAGHLLMA
jgi:hypothetical protein